MNMLKRSIFFITLKWSAIEFKGIGTIVVGAAEKIISGELPEDIHELMLQGMRTMPLVILKRLLMIKKSCHDYNH